MEAPVGQDDGSILEVLDEGMKLRIVGVGRGGEPFDDLSAMVDEQAQFRPDDPARVGEALATDLPRAAPLADRVDQLDSVAVDHPQQGRRGQKQQGPLLVSFELSKQSSAFGQAGKQEPVIPRQSTIKGAIAHALERVQHPQRHDLARPQHRLRVLRQALHPVIDPAEQLRDKVDRGQDRALAGSIVKCHYN